MRLSKVLPLLLTLCFACPIFGQVDTEDVKAIRFGKLINGIGKVSTNAIVIVKGNRIQSILSGDSQIPKGAQVINLSAFTGMPGMIDAHTHLTYWWDKNSRKNPNAEVASMLPQELVFLAQENARKCIEIGVTTVRDLAAGNYSDIAMRNLINRGAMVGPRMFVAGPAMSAGGPVPHYGEVFPWVVPNQGEASGVPEVIRLVRQELGAGADLIKMFGSTGGFNESDSYR